MRLDAVIAFKWLLADAKLVEVVTVEGSNSRSVSDMSVTFELFRSWSFSFDSTSPTKSAAAPTSRKP